MIDRSRRAGGIARNGPPVRVWKSLSIANRSPPVREFPPSIGSSSLRLAELELFAERDLGRPLAGLGVFRIERPPALAFVGPIVATLRTRGVPVEAVAACRAELELTSFFEQPIGERKLHGWPRRAKLRR